MKIEIEVSKDNTEHLLNLGLSGCVELLNYPELCLLKNDREEPSSNPKDGNDFSWYMGGTLVHALALGGCCDILKFPEYLKLENNNKTTPLHLLVMSFLSERWSDEVKPISLEDAIILNKILEIEDLCDLKNKEGETPLHTIASLGHLPILGYEGIENIESPEFNTHGSPMTLLYRNALSGIDTLLRHPSVLKDYETHGTPVEELSRNKKIRPTVKTLKEYGFRIENKWHPSKKLDIGVVKDILSVPNSIKFIIY